MKDTEETDPGRRHFLKCMAWAGTGALWTMSSGILKGSPLGQIARLDDVERYQRAAVRADQR